MALNNIFHTSFYKSIISLALLVYGLTAWNSHGYYQADEHYQVIEFAGEKFGTNISFELPWEWRTQSRQAIQPTMVFLIFSGLHVLGLHDAYILAFVLRLISMLLSLWAIHFFLKSTLDRIRPEYHKYYIILSYFLWFLPVTYVRFSSEVWSAAMLLFVFSIVLSDRMNDKKSPFVIGFLLGMAFLFRYQSAFLSLGLLAWLVFIYKESFQRLIKLIASGLFVLFLGVLIDSWYYGEWLFVPWRYFNYQVLKDMSSTFGASNWYFYLEKMVVAPGWPLGMIFVASLVFLIVRDRKNPIVWGLLPFIVSHSFVPHKEIRFFFVFINLLPFIVFTSVQLLPSFSLPRIIKDIGKVVLVLFAVLNLVGLVAMSSKSAGLGRQEISKYIHDNFVGKSVNLIYTSWASPYNPWHAAPAKFYLDHNVLESRIHSLCDLNDSLINNEVLTLIVIRKAEFNAPECSANLTSHPHKILAQSVPDWILSLNKFYGQLDENEVLVLYEISSTHQR